MFILVDVGKKTSVFWLGWKIGLSYHWGRLESLRPWDCLYKAVFLSFCEYWMVSLQL